MSAMVDPRQPRIGQGITGTALLAGFLLDAPVVVPVIAGVLAAASLLGGRGNLYAHLFRAIRPLLPPPRELEDAAPPRFANSVGFVFLAAASVAHFGLGAEAAAWALALIVSGLALLAAATGLCVGCELYLMGRRTLARGADRAGT